jgi:hypothetical protein
MDCGQFDSLARLVSSKQSRRAALGTLLGATLLRHDPAAVLAKGKGRVKAQAKAGAKNKPCYPSARCTPGKGKNTSGCDYSFSALFEHLDVRGSNLSKSSFRGADLRGADLRGANASGSCFVGADLHEAKVGASVNLNGAIFCNTRMPDGRIDDSGCAKTTACCPPLERDCPDGTIECWVPDSSGVCQQLVNGFPSVARCGHGLACCPCENPDLSHWSAKCNQAFSACNGKCVAVDEGAFSCWLGCSFCC